jgi:hypothetical protein
MMSGLVAAFENSAKVVVAGVVATLIVMPPLVAQESKPKAGPGPETTSPRSAGEYQ